MEEVFLNLYNNAKDSMKNTNKKTLTITTKKENNNAIILIEDTGEGIEDPVKERIFDPFFTTKDVGKGAGLGLAVSHGIIAQHHGKIVLKKTQKGTGSTFEIILPLAS